MKKLLYITLMAVLVVTALAGCGAEEVAQPAPADVGGSETDSGATVDTSYANALDVGSQLALGTIRLEETENDIAPEQAVALLPLWQAIQAGTLQGEAETNAVLNQIEGKMTSEQLAAIAAMQLTQDDLRAWAESQGLNLASSPDEMVTRMVKGSQELSPEVQATMEAMREAGGGPPTDLSEEEREAMRATAEASGMSFGGRGFGSAGQSAILTEPLIELLTQRAAK